MTQLTPHFSLEELTATQVRGVDNTPPVEIVAVLGDTATRMEEVRKLLGQSAIHVNSGYRCDRANTLVGGRPNSAHLTGRAVDFICPSFGTPLDICRAIGDLEFDQLIEEGAWVHLSFARTFRKQILTKSGSGYILGLPPKRVTP